VLSGQSAESGALEQGQQFILRQTALFEYCQERSRREVVVQGNNGPVLPLAQGEVASALTHLFKPCFFRARIRSWPEAVGSLGANRDLKGIEHHLSRTRGLALIVEARQIQVDGLPEVRLRLRRLSAS
jgi:hypothetical protein